MLDLSTTTLTGKGLADESYLFQSLIQEAGNGATVFFPTGFKVGVATTINTIGLEGQRWIGEGCVGESGYDWYGGGTGGLNWLGPAGQPIIQMNNSRDFQIQDLVIRGDGANAPSAEVEIDELTTSPVITTNIHFQRVQFVAPANSIGHACVAIARTGLQNCEGMTFDDCWFMVGTVQNAGGVGIYIGDSSNAMSIEANRCKVMNGASFIQAMNGGFSVNGGLGEFQRTVFDIRNASAPIAIRGFNSEYAGCGAACNGVMPVLLEDCRFAAMSIGAGAPFASGPCLLSLKRNKIDAGPGPLPNNLVTGGSALYLLSEGNYWMSWAAAALNTVAPTPTLSNPNNKYGFVQSIADSFLDINGKIHTPGVVFFKTWE